MLHTQTTIRGLLILGSLAVLLVSIAGTSTLAKAVPSTFEAQVKAFQNGNWLDDETAGVLGSPIDCIAGTEQPDAVKMECFLIPPGVPPTPENAQSMLDTTTTETCPSDGGFGNIDTCWRVTFGADEFTQQGEWHFVAQFKDGGGNIVDITGSKDYRVHSFFVLPESALGAIAVVGSSLAALGGYKFLKPRQKI